MPAFRARIIDDLAQLDTLPALPAVVSRLLTMVDDPMVSAMDVAYILRQDPALTARILRMANSPVYGGRYRIVSVPQAVLRLGMTEVRNLVMSLGIIRAVFGKGRRLDYRAFWHHSLTVALASEALGAALPPDPEGADEGAFATGLLHDIGRLALDQLYPEAYDEAMRVMVESKLPLLDAERRAIGIDHAEVGRALAKRWGLPDTIVSGLAYHHRPEEAPPHLARSALLVNVAEQTCRAHGLGDPLEGGEIEEPTQRWQDLGLAPERVTKLVTTTIAGARKSAVLLSLA